MIPKRLICTHISPQTLEPKLKHCTVQMRKMHPDWEYLFFSDGDCEDFVKHRCPDFLELY